MWIYFNKQNTLVEQIDHGEEPARVGSVGAFKIFAYFEGIDTNDYATATIRLKKPDLTEQIYPDLFMEVQDRTFVGYDGEKLNYFRNNKNYKGYLFNFNIVGLLDTPGLWKGTITLYSSNGHAPVSGLITFNVQESVYDEEDVDLTRAEWQTLLTNYIATKLPINSNTYIKVIQKLADVGYFDPTKYSTGDLIFDVFTEQIRKITVLDPATTELVEDLKNGYVKRSTNSTDYVAYTRNAGVEGVTNISVNGDASTIAIRDASGHVKTAEPSSETDATNKTYVDSNFVHNTGNETISGVKTFTNNTVFNGNIGTSGTDLGFSTSIRPVGAQDLGTSVSKWKDAYISGSLKGNSGSEIAVSDIQHKLTAGPGITIANNVISAESATNVPWSIVTGTPTTLSGYGITDAKILNGTITLGTNTITPLTEHQSLAAYRTSAAQDVIDENIVAIAEGKNSAYAVTLKYVSNRYKFDGDNNVYHYENEADKFWNEDGTVEKTMDELFGGNSIKFVEGTILYDVGREVIIPLDDLKVGDMLYFTELDVPDRWLSVISDTYWEFHKLETSKVDIANMVTTDTAQTISGTKTFTTSLKTVDIEPTNNGTEDIGTSALKYRDLYLSGSLKDGANSVSVENIKHAVNGIYLIDAPTSSTMTDEVYNLLVGGAVVIFNGVYQGVYNPKFRITSDRGSSYAGTVEYGDISNTANYIQCNLSKSTKELSLYYYPSYVYQNQFRPGKVYTNELTLSGKQFPAYPSSPANSKVLTYGSNNTLSWEDAQSGGGTVTSITAGNGLTGGTISTSGTIAVDTSVVATKSDLTWPTITNKPNTISGYNITDAFIQNGTIRLGNETLTPITDNPEWNDITGKPTTISGYGITDAKIENGEITLGNQTITPITSHQSLSAYRTSADQDIIDNNIRAIAEGKNKAIVISCTQTAPSTDAQAQQCKKLDGTTFASLAEFNTYIGGGTIRNSEFNTQSDNVVISGATDYIIDLFKVVRRLSDKYGLSIGDWVWITQTNVPDRWFTGVGDGTFAKSETAKVDVEWSAIQNKPTTLSGYGITDVNINNGVITIGSNTITPLTQHQNIKSVNSQSLVGTGNIAVQDVISDLSTIRSGANLGATAVQPATLNNYATNNALNTGLNAKQDTLSSGVNIKTINNQSIMGSGNITISAGISYEEE